jgi:uncharacterized protein
MTCSRKNETVTKFVGAILFTSAVGLGCARVEVQAPKDPIKMDISMRLDVYQHVVKDIDQIESIVSGKSPVQTAFAEFLVKSAYAADLDPAVEQAALRRRDRLAQVQNLLSQGIVGEDREGYLALRAGGPGADSVVHDENADRHTIYQALASQNGTSVGEIQKVYAGRLSSDAPGGSPVQGPDGNWTTK